MKCDFKIEAGIYLRQDNHDLDLHNSYEFTEVKYAINTRSVTLKWRRANRPEVQKDIPLTLSIEFREVSTFEFLPRNSDQPFGEDDCLSTFGNWHSDHGVIIYDDGFADHEEPIAISFMSGATIVIEATSAHATIGSAKS